MPQTFKSPGVETNEIDQSFLQQAVALPGAVLIGRTLKGPAFVPTTVRDFTEFSTVFGGTQEGLFVPYAAKAYLANSTSLTVVRVLGHADGTTTTNGYTGINSVGIIDASGNIGVTGSVLAVVHTTASFAAVTVSGVSGDVNRFVFKVGTLFAATASFLTSSDDYIGKALNTDPTKHSTYGHYVYQLFPYQKQAASASWSPVQNVSSSFTTFTRDFTDGQTTFVKSQPIGGIEYDLFRFWTLSSGRATNDAVKVLVSNVRPSSAPSSQPYGTFDVIVRSFYDTDSRPVEYERFANLTLDPNSPNYVIRRIGDAHEVFDTATRKFVKTQGRFDNRSRLVRVELNSNANYPPQALPWGFRGYPKALFSGSSIGTGLGLGTAAVPTLPYTPNQIDPNGNFNPGVIWGVSFVSGGVADRMRAEADGALSAFVTASDADFTLANLTSSYVNGNLRYSYLSTWGRYTPIFSSGTLQSFALPFYGGFDGFDLRVQDSLYLNNSDTDTTLGVVAQKRAVDSVANPDIISADVIALPGQHNLAVTDYARSLVNSRRDMFYVMDLTGSTRQDVISLLTAREIDDNYTGAYYPDLWYSEPLPSGRVVRVPPSVGVLGAIALTDRVAQAFFAPAGLNRGGLAHFNVTDIVDRLNHDDRDTLYDARINPITRFPNEGIVIFGQKTLQRAASALDRINVRRLLILAKRTIAGEARQLVFEPNSPPNWTRFVNKVNPILEGYRRDRGINRFKVVMDSTTNTSDVIDRNEMKGKIFLEPVKAAEFITVDFVIAASGVSFGS
jgi:hypothetical protein